VKILLTLAALGLAGLAAACAGPPSVRPAVAMGNLTGHLYGVGGPAPGAPRPWSGTVTLIGPYFHRDIQVGADGVFSVFVPPGTYTVTGRSPLYQSGTGVCRAAGATTVSGGHRTQADVLCQMR
jgi:hypothetical protein